MTISSQPSTITGPNDFLEITGLDESISSLTIDFADASIDSFANTLCSISDDGSRAYYPLPTSQCSPWKTPNYQQTIHTYGNLHAIKISFPSRAISSGFSTTYPLRISAVTINETIALNISPLRIALMVALVCFLFLFRPNSALRRIYPFQEHAETGEKRFLAISAKTFVLVMIAAIMAGALFTHNTLFNSYYAPPDSPKTIVDYGSYDEYESLAHSFLEGRLDLLLDPPSYMESLSNVYDESQRIEAATQTGESWKRDAAYYDGRYYVYFGVAPVLLLYVPFLAVTGHDLPNGYAVLLFLAFALAGFYALLRTVIRYHFKQTDLAVFLLLFIGVTLSSFVLIAAGQPNIYQIPIISGICFSVWGFTFWHEYWHTDKTRQLFIGSLCMSLVAACRPQLLILSLFGIPLIIRMFGKKRMNARIGDYCALIIPFAIVAGGLMWYNAARFGSPFDFGANYNLAGNDMTLRGFASERLVDGIFAYLMQPPTVISTFPYLIGNTAMFNYQGMTVNEETFGGIFAIAPFLLSVFWAAKLRSASKGLFKVFILLVICAVILVCFDTESGGILGRYIQDFSFIFAFAAALVWLALFAKSDTTQPYILLLTCTLFALCFSLMLFVFMCSTLGYPTTGLSEPRYWELLRNAFQIFQ